MNMNIQLVNLERSCNLSFYPYTYHRPSKMKNEGNCFVIGLNGWFIVFVIFQKEDLE